MTSNMNQLNVTLAFVTVIVAIILIVVCCAVNVDFKKLLEKIRKRSWE